MSCNKCKPVWSRLLEIEEISITPPTAVFSLGCNFRCNKIKVEAEITVGGDITKRLMTLRTNSEGQFSYSIPTGTTNITQSVILCVNQTNPSNVLGKNCIKVRGEYPCYTNAQLAWRNYGGIGNNMRNPEFGAIDIALLRQSPADYADGLNSLAVRAEGTGGAGSTNPRNISNVINAQSSSVPNSFGLTNMLWVFGQGIDHEIDLTETNSSDPASITVPPSDPDYAGLIIPFNRSQTVEGTGVTTPREQPNHITSFLDGTNVYGYISSRARALRLMDGTGKLKTTTADNGEVILPYNTEGLPNAQADPTVPVSDFFLAGDVRANENTFLTAFHTLFVREHNRLCDEIVAERPAWAGEDELIYQHARRTVAGIMQSIVYNEFLPALLGDGLIDDYEGYDATVNPGINTEFSTAGYRLGHTMIPSALQVSETPGDTELLRDLFFNPAYVQANGVDNMLIGASTTVMQEIDGLVVDDLRNFLFFTPTMTMMHDLPSLNIQRGRDHGLPGYNAVRTAYGLSAASSFADVTSNASLQAKLAVLYASPDEIDPWVGGIIEDHLPGRPVGELVATILKDQFERLRDGDRYYFYNDPAFSQDEKTAIQNTKMSDVIIRNTQWTTAEIPEDVFHV